MTGGTARRPPPRTSRAERERIYQRRRRAAVALAAAFTILLIWGLSAIIGGGGGANADRPKPSELPRGGRVVLPRYRLVAYYGAPQHDALGQLGIGSPEKEAAAVVRQARSYARPGRPALPVFELIATLAQSDPGADGMNRLRQTPAVIKQYLEAVRRIKGLLILDIQPGHSAFMDEVEALTPYLLQPDVGLALDPEWSLPPGHVPGKEIGSTDATTVNDVSAYLAKIVQVKNLPQKVLIVHQFTEGMVKGRDQVVDRPGVAIVHNVDGFGVAPSKIAVYDKLAYKVGAGAAGTTGASGAAGASGASGAAQASDGKAGRFNGFKLFFHEDTGLMTPSQVLDLKPAPDVVVYE
jgi:hypothetical protein